MTKPIIERTGTMVRAILDGNKTQTRRIVKLPPLQPWQHRSKGWDSPECLHSSENVNNFIAAFSDGIGTIISIKCPYGKPAFAPFNMPADRLWVREAWNVSSAHDHLSPKDIPSTTKAAYAADGPQVYVLGKGRPSIFMPRWASRILLEITDIRVERLQDISEADARAEGVTPTAFEKLHDNWGGVLYRKLWESIHGPGSWETNPFVWVIQFQKIQQS